MKHLKKLITSVLPILFIGIFSTYSYSQCSDCLKNALKSLVTEEIKNYNQFIDLTGSNIESNILKLKNLTKDNFILIDNSTLSKHEVSKQLKLSKARICLKTLSENDKNIKALIKRKIDKINIISLIPTNEKEIKNVYSGTSKLNSNDLKNSIRQMKKAKTLFDEIENTEVLKITDESVLTIAQIVERKASESHGDDLLVIVGHNENMHNDRVLKCPDGSTISMSKLTRILDHYDRPSLILSCETMTVLDLHGLATTKRLEFDEMATALKKCQENIKNYESPEMKDFISELEFAFKESESNLMKNTYIVVGSSGGAIIVTFALSFATSD